MKFVLCAMELDFMIDRQPSLLLQILVMLAEIVLLLFVFFGILCLLNYFSIITLSRSFPVLSFLPHQKSQRVATTSATPSLLQLYLTSAVAPSYLPRQALSDALLEENADKTVREFGWEIPSQIRGGITLSYTPTHELKGYTILLVPEAKTSSSALTVVDALRLKEQYFQPVSVTPVFHCSTAPTLSQCLSFQQSNQGKIGFAFQKSYGVLTLLFCNVSSENTLITSCLDPHL